MYMTSLNHLVENKIIVVFVLCGYVPRRYTGSIASSQTVKILLADLTSIVFLQIHNCVWHLSNMIYLPNVDSSEDTDSMHFTASLSHLQFLVPLYTLNSHAQNKNCTVSVLGLCTFAGVHWVAYLNVNSFSLSSKLYVCQCDRHA